MATFDGARNSCLALGGDLVAYTSFEAQLKVERYFTKQVPLYSYWLGLQRPDNASEYTWLDGSPVPQAVESGSAYPHWAWLQPQLASSTSAHCVAAWSNYQYERFLGDVANSSQVRSQTFYQTGSADKLYAWGAQPCNVRFATVCAMPASSFPCYPPPSPPPPPPQPPSPPVPPMPPSCAPRTSASFYCDAQLGMCYNYSSGGAFFDRARTACQDQGGELVKYERCGPAT
jgi:hypothetical protein